MTSGNSVGQPVRVVLTELPSMMVGLMQAALDKSGMSVMRASTYQEAVLLATETPGIGVVIVPTASTGLRDAFADALCRNPSVKCLTVSASPHRADLFELRLLGTDVGRHGVV